MDENTAGEGTKKYIRTLAGDMKVVEEGGTPDLAPLTEGQSSARDRLVASSPLPPAKELIPTSEAEQAPIPPPVVVPPPAPVPTPIQTYASDFSKQVKETGAVTATILAAEQDAATQPIATEEASGLSKKNLIYIISGSVLVIVGIGSAYFAYTRFAATSVPVITQEATAPIFVDERQEISGNGTQLLQAIEQSVSRPLAPRAVRHLYLASSTDSVFARLQFSAPDILRRNVNAEGSMVGVVNTGGKQSPFFILSTSAYRDTFAGMLAWESTMTNSLSGLFPLYAPQSGASGEHSAPQNVLASTTQAIASTTHTAPAFTPGFRDEVVSNHDVRVYRDSAGRGVLLYGYWNQTTLVIARDPLAFTEIISRLATFRAQP